MKKRKPTVTPEQARFFGSQGGKKSHELGKRHTWTSEEAKKAAKKSHAARRRKKNWKIIDVQFEQANAMIAAYNRHFGKGK